jgi:ribosomal protein L37AE/L43A
MYPRSKNGFVDSGVSQQSSERPCPNCGSNAYRETLSMESCDACGLRCDYWGGGANEVYENMMAKHAK